MNKKIIFLFMFCGIYGLSDCLEFELSDTFKIPASDLNDQELSDPFTTPDSAFNVKEKDSILNDKDLSDSFITPDSEFNAKEKDSILNDKDLSDSFTTPISDLNDQELSDSFKFPDSQYQDQDYYNITQQNVINTSIISDVEDYSFWLGIYCQNINPIAGFQFELPKNLELLDVEGIRSADAGFQLHHNKTGLILGFSMSGDAIAPVTDKSKVENCLLVKLYVKADKQAVFSFPIKTILAGQKGEKLSFKNIQDQLLINDQAAIFSFDE